MEEKTRKVLKTTINGRSRRAAKRGRAHRFSKWVEGAYGIPYRSMYEKLRHGRIKTWEGAGIIRCMDDFGFHGTPEELWQRCVRNRFCEFMEERQMSRATVWKRFGAADFSSLEMEGISAVYRRWRREIDC